MPHILLPKGKKGIIYFIDRAATSMVAKGLKRLSNKWPIVSHNTRIMKYKGMKYKGQYSKMKNN